MLITVELGERVQRLRENLVNLEHAKYREVKDLTILNDEKALREPLVVRKALAFAFLLDETSTVIMDDELIVGLRTNYALLKENETGYNNPDPMFRSKGAGLSKYNRMCFPHYLIETEVEAAQQVGVAEGQVTCHCTFGVEKVLRLGFGGIAEQAHQRMRELENAAVRDSKKIEFLRTVIIVLEAASHFVSRYAEEAELLAKKTQESRRREELERIAKTCRWIAVNPARSFYEALQLFWFGYLVQHIENYFSGPIGRFDQDLYTYYKRDLEAGRITRDEALELLECLFIKICEEDDVSTDSHANIMLSGQDSKGNDVTNELTYLCLDASVALKLEDPKIGVRLHKRSPPELLKKCCEIIKDSGMGGFPSLYNDEALIPAMQRIGIPLRDARLYANDGCQETTIPGKGDFYPVFTSIRLLDALNRVLQRRIQWDTFDELMEAYKTEIVSTIKTAVEEANDRERALPRFSQVPYLSSTLEGCIENALDKTEGGATYNYTGFLGVCFANAVNSLAGIKTLVYDDKLVSMTLLKELLAKNWEGYERLRQLTINRVPKYGNDDDYVDSLAVEVADLFIREVLKYENTRGGRYYPGFYNFMPVVYGLDMGATTDGRRAGDNVSVHASPAVGTDVSGPIAVLNSAIKICKLLPPEGAPLDVRFHPSALNGEEGTENLMALIKTYFEQGGIQLQFNIVDSQILRNAQKDPEQYKNLIVRVWGFSAYFITLSPEYQENVIKRSEHLFA